MAHLDLWKGAKVTECLSEPLCFDGELLCIRSHLYLWYVWSSTLHHCCGVASCRGTSHSSRFTNMQLRYRCRSYAFQNEPESSVSQGQLFGAHVRGGLELRAAALDGLGANRPLDDATKKRNRIYLFGLPVCRHVYE